MAFVKYTGTNLAQGSLNVGISAASGSLTLKSGEGALFPSSFPFILKIEKIVTGAVTKREMVICTNRSSDTFTITRSGEYCPADDTALTQTNTAFAFDADDVVTLVMTYGMIKDMQDEIATKQSATIGNWKVVYSNGSGVITELALPTAGKVLTGNGTTSAPTFETPTVDINGLTEVSALSDSDMVVVYDSSAGVNKKYKSDKLAHYYGDGSDGAISGALTITGSNDSYILKEYTTFAPGANTVTVTPTNCIVHIKIQGNCDLTGTTFNFAGKGGVGGAGVSRDADRGTSVAGQNGLRGRTTGGIGIAANLTGDQTDAGIIPSTSVSLLEAIETKLGFVVSAGAGGSGGSASYSFGNYGGAGGNGGGALIIEVGGDLILSSTTINCNGSDGSNAISTGGGGGGGGGGSLLMIYQGTLTGTTTPNVTAGNGGTGTSNSGGGGGSSAVANGSNNSGTTGGAGGAGEYLIINQKQIN